MRNGTRKELKRLEAELLAEEQPQTGGADDFDDGILFENDDTAPADVHVPYRNYANGYRAYTNQPCDVDLDSYSEEVRTGKRLSNAPLIILALVLFTCIVLVLCWWVWRYFGGLR